MDALETFTVTYRGVDYEAAIHHDQDAPSPRESGTIADLVQFDSHYRQPDKHVDLVCTLVDAWERWRDEDMIGRYLVLFHDIVAWDYITPQDEGRVFGYVTRDAMTEAWDGGEWTAAQAKQVVRNELELYRAWAAGEVFGVEVTDPRDGCAESLWGIFTADGSTDDEYLRQIAEDLARGLAAS